MDKQISDVRSLGHSLSGPVLSKLLAIQNLMYPRAHFKRALGGPVSEYSHPDRLEILNACML